MSKKFWGGISAAAPAIAAAGRKAGAVGKAGGVASSKIEALQKARGQMGKMGASKKARGIGGIFGTAASPFASGMFGGRGKMASAMVGMQPGRSTLGQVHKTMMGLKQHPMFGGGQPPQPGAMPQPQRQAGMPGGGYFGTPGIIPGAGGPPQQGRRFMQGGPQMGNMGQMTRMGSYSR